MTQSANSAGKTSPGKSSNRRPWLLVLIFRLLLLGVGGGLALVLGIFSANLFPNLNPEKPLLIRLLERLENKTPLIPPTPSSSATPGTTDSLPQLTPAQQQQAQAQLTQLQNQFKGLSEAITDLETQLGTRRPNEPLETRLQAIAMQVQGVSASNLSAQAIGDTNSSPIGATAMSLIQSDKLKVTLPSDLLFEQNNSILRSEADLILDKIVADIRKYPASTIRIGVYTDTNGEAEANQELSYRRAKAVEQYFTNTLEGQYRWLVVGYGETYPMVANDTVSNQQRNRRVEIAVD